MWPIRSPNRRCPMGAGETYVAYEATIRKGWFRRKLEELGDLLETLERKGLITAREREDLLRLAREMDAGGSNSPPLFDPGEKK
jgi:hypothetical protein